MENIIKKVLENIDGLSYSICLWKKETNIILIYNNIASCTLTINLDNSINIYNLYVQKESRKLGIATKLLNIIEELAYKLDKKELFLFCTPNTWKYYWYCKIGYTYYTNSGNPKGTVWLNKILN